NYYVDGMFMINDTGDAKSQTGVALKLATSLRNDINLFFKPLFSQTTEHSNSINETDYRQIQGLFGAEYIYSLPQYPIAISFSAGVGISRTEIEPKDDTSGLEELKETGMAYGLWLGGQWLLTQWVAPFIELGYSKSLYNNDLDGASIGGMQIAIGVRFTIWGKNKTFTSDYE
ncbi:MAG TPA: hypothetical protein PLX22_08500, partial [Spirochaetota bacterium]|nr:hypothetical protein [Spirochaetota bacterium]HRR61800.1 hypothetical protein [Spirochaetota bacterium]